MPMTRHAVASVVSAVLAVSATGAGTFAGAVTTTSGSRVTDVTNAELATRYDPEGYGPQCSHGWETCAHSRGNGAVARIGHDSARPAHRDGSLRIATPSADDKVLLRHHHGSPVPLRDLEAASYRLRAVSGEPARYTLTVQCDADSDTVLELEYAGPVPAAGTGWHTVDVVDDDKAPWRTTAPVETPILPLGDIKNDCKDGVVLAHGLGADSEGSASRVDHVRLNDEVVNFQMPWLTRIGGFLLESTHAQDQYLMASQLSRRYFYTADQPDDSSPDPSRRREDGPKSEALVIANQKNTRALLLAGPLANAIAGELHLKASGQAYSWCGAEHGPAYILGFGEKKTLKVERLLRWMGCEPVTVAAPTIQRTAVKVARIIDRARPSGIRPSVVLASGAHPAQSLSASALAGSRHGSVLLTEGARMSTAAHRYLRAHPRAVVYAIGADAASAAPRLRQGRRIVGSNRYTTAAAVAERFFQEPETASFAPGSEEVEALLAAAYAGHQHAPVLLVRRHAVPAVIARYVRDHRGEIRDAVLVGTDEYVSEETFEALTRLLAPR